MTQPAFVENGLVKDIGPDMPEYSPGMIVDLPDDAKIGWTMQGDEWAPPFLPEPPPVDLKAYAAQARHTKETGGVAYLGRPIATDEGSQGKIGNAALGAQIVGSAFATNWKGSDGVFFPLSQSGVIGMALAVLGFVNSCYGAEDTVAAGLAAGTITTKEQIDAAFAAVPSIF